MEQRNHTELNRRAFDELIVDHQKVIQRLVFRLLGWRDGVEDIVQEVFLSAWTARSRFPGSAVAAFWLKRIAINKCRSYLRHEAVRLRWLQWMRNVGWKDSGDIPHDQLNHEERACLTRRAIQSLEPSYREVTVLYYLEQLSLDEIAGLTGIQRNTVEVRLHRARKKLELLLKDLKE